MKAPASFRLHDVRDADSLLQRLLPALAAGGRGWHASYAALDAEGGVLHRRWSTGPTRPWEAATIRLEPERLHRLLHDDAAGDRPWRPLDSASAWAVADLLPDAEPERALLRIRAIGDGGRLLGVLGIAVPRGPLQRFDADAVQPLADVLELGLARLHLLDGLARAEGGHREALAALSRRSGERLRTLEQQLATARAAAADLQPRLEALESAAGRATELLLDAHVELAGRNERLRRQARLFFLLRRVLERYGEGPAPHALAGELVRLVSEACGGSRCSLLLVDPSATGDGGLRVAAALGLPPGVDAAGVRVRTGSGISGRVLRSREPLVVRDLGEGEALPRIQDAAYTGDAFVSLPLLCRGQVLGVLNLTNFREGTFDDAELEQFRLVALCLALVVDHARLSERLFPAEAR